MNDALISFLGLAKKAGKLSYGHDRTLELINSKKCELIVFASDYSSKQAEDIKLACKQNNIKMFKLKHSMKDLVSITSNLSGVLALKDKNFCKKTKRLIEQNNCYIVDIT